jgi:hypothetical protein
MLDVNDMMNEKSLAAMLTKMLFFSTVWARRKSGRKRSPPTFDAAGYAPKFNSEDDTSKLLAVVRTSLKDANVTVDGTDGTVVGTLSNGLRRSFTSTVLKLVPMLIAGYTEKNAAMLTAVDGALDHRRPHGDTLLLPCRAHWTLVNETWSVKTDEGG